MPVGALLPRSHRLASLEGSTDGNSATESRLRRYAAKHYPLFDDPAVLQARRLALAGLWPRAARALTVDPVHFAGSVWVRSPDTDPFRLLGRPEVVQVGAGILGDFPRPTGPAIERYAGAPWPAGGF